MIHGYYVPLAFLLFRTLLVDVSKICTYNQETQADLRKKIYQRNQNGYLEWVFIFTYVRV